MLAYQRVTMFVVTRYLKIHSVSPGVMATECRHSSQMAAEEQETIIMNRAMKKKEVRLRVA